MFQTVNQAGVSFFAFSEWDDIPGFVQAFTCRQTDSPFSDAGRHLEVADRKPALLEVLRLERRQLRLLRQVHSDRIVIDPCPDNRPAADGILLRQAGVFGVIRTADCVPLVAVTRDPPQVALLHAGWRGTRDHIVSQGVGRLLQSAGVSPEQVSVGIGPAIRGCCYQVGSEVKEQFLQKGHPVEQIFNGRLLDLVAANRADLENLGVTQVLDCEICTACQSDRFYSYRKLKDQGRMWALAGFRE